MFVRKHFRAVPLLLVPMKMMALGRRERRLGQRRMPKHRGRLPKNHGRRGCNASCGSATHVVGDRVPSKGLVAPLVFPGEGGNAVGENAGLVVFAVQAGERMHWRLGGGRAVGRVMVLSHDGDLHFVEKGLGGFSVHGGALPGAVIAFVVVAVGQVVEESEGRGVRRGFPAGGRGDEGTGLGGILLIAFFLIDGAVAAVFLQKQGVVAEVAVVSKHHFHGAVNDEIDTQELNN
mmetsp:Transcript_31595/g.66913  ORF Transcript_31595/g.66913 Transcript_31595/m.66913 type:complete len:233 (-) Transcript_31595:112-810(-)